ncbi:hypothetical protein [Mesorhizobium sp. B2-3-12]|uniref:hypothetical protein n=1 Tax=Mesorhizobium sp. B2-3-12 TaxID=2589952 RepID=UPI001FEDE345|nr:hypothetical protein [Mesorhizobium sp. B2-3-12]
MNTKTQTSDLVASLHGDILPSYLAGQATVSFVGNGEEGCPSQADQKFTFQVNDKALINEYFDSIARQSAHYFSLTDGKSDVSDKVKLAAERETGGLLATDLTSMVNDASFRDIRVLVGKGGGPSSIANCKKLVLHWSAGGGSQEEPEAGTAKAIIRNASFTLYDASGKALNRFPIESKQLGKSDATGAILAGDTEYQKLLPLSSVILARELQNGSGKSVEIKY